MTKLDCDRTVAPILAWDFDGVITLSDNHYPDVGKIRPYIADVMNLLFGLGFINVIWTCRRDDDVNMINCLYNNHIHYNAINCSFQFAPFDHESRKIFAHRYYDDRAFGWRHTEQLPPEHRIVFDILVDALGLLIREGHPDDNKLIHNAIPVLRDHIMSEHVLRTTDATELKICNDLYKSFKEKCEDVKHVIHRWGIQEI